MQGPRGRNEPQVLKEQLEGQRGSDSGGRESLERVTGALEATEDLGFILRAKKSLWMQEEGHWIWSQSPGCEA